MVAALISLAVVALKPDPFAVAFSARYYYPPSVKKLSRSQLYTCAIDGSHRHCWTNGRGEVRDVWWKSHAVLGYSIDFSGPTYKQGITEEWELSLSTAMRKLTAKGLTRDFNRVRHQFPGDAKPMVDAEMLIKKTGHKIQWKFEEGALSIEGKPPVALEDEIDGFKFDEKADRFWIFTRGHDSTTGTNFCAYLVNWKTNQPVAKLTHARMADFRTDRTTYAMISQRDTMKYDKNRTVWMSQAIIGDWKTGEHYLIAGPALLDDNNLHQPFQVTAKHPDQSYQFAIGLRP